MALTYPNEDGKRKIFSSKMDVNSHSLYLQKLYSSLDSRQ